MQATTTQIFALCHELIAMHAVEPHAGFIADELSLRIAPEIEIRLTDRQRGTGAVMVLVNGAVVANEHPLHATFTAGEWVETLLWLAHAATQGVNTDSETLCPRCNAQPPAQMPGAYDWACAGCYLALIGDEPLPEITSDAHEENQMRTLTPEEQAARDAAWPKDGNWVNSNPETW